MKRDMSTSAKVRRLIDKGYTNKAIIERLGCKPQAVYNIRYQVNKARGLGAIGALPKPTEGIGEPPKRKRKVRAGTGITPTPPVQYPNDAMRAPYLVTKEPFAITMVEPEPTVFDKVRERFRNLMRALRG